MSTITLFHDTLMFKLNTPDRVTVKVFTSLHPFIWGYPRLDSDTVKCVDPWTTAMKYVDHMTSRGWAVNQVDNVANKRGSIVFITMERPLV